MNEELVSIITPVYNAELYLEEAIQSVLGQTYQNWEMIIIDDCSQDNSPNIIKKYAEQESRILYLKNADNNGVTKTRNMGLKNAKGRFIAFLDSDDVWLPQKLKKQITFMHNNSIVLCYSAYHVIDRFGCEGGAFRPPQKLTYKALLKSNSVGCLTVVYDVQKTGKIYFKDFGHEDYIAWLEILKVHKCAYGLTEKLAKYRVIPHSVSSNKLKAAMYQWKIYRRVEGLSFLASCYYFLCYAYHGFFKYKIS